MISSKGESITNDQLGITNDQLGITDDESILNIAQTFKIKFTFLQMLSSKYCLCDFASLRKNI